MMKALQSELQEEDKRYDDAEAKFQDLQEQLQRLVKMLQACICMVLMVTVWSEITILNVSSNWTCWTIKLFVLWEQILYETYVGSLNFESCNHVE